MLRSVGAVIAVAVALDVPMLKPFYGALPSSARGALALHLQRRRTDSDSNSLHSISSGSGSKGKGTTTSNLPDSDPVDMGVPQSYYPELSSADMEGLSESIAALNRMRMINGEEAEPEAEAEAREKTNLERALTEYRTDVLLGREGVGRVRAVGVRDRPQSDQGEGGHKYELEYF